MTEKPLINSWRYKAVIISVIVASLGYLAFSFWAGWTDVVNTILQIGIWGVLAILGLSLFNYLIRFIRWQKYLSVYGYHVPLVENACIYLAGFALTTTPGKAGEALRSLLLKPYNVSITHSLAALLSERLSDLIAIILLTLIGLSHYSAARFMIIVSIVAIVIGLWLIVNKRFLTGLSRKLSTHKGKMVNLLRQLCYILIEAQQCHTPKLIVSATLLSVLAWSAEAFAFYCILQWMGADISLSFALFVYALSMLAGALSFMPGGLGGAEAVMICLLIMKGMNKPDAVAATVVIRFATLWFAVAIGSGLLLIKLNKSLTPKSSVNKSS